MTSDKIVKVGGSSAIAGPRIVAMHYDLSSAEMIREAFLHLPDTFKERVELVKCARAELVEGTTQKGIKIECAESLEALGLVYSFGPSETWRPTMLGIYVARSLVGSHAELTRPGADSPPSMVKRVTREEIARNEAARRREEERRERDRQEREKHRPPWADDPPKRKAVKQKPAPKALGRARKKP